MRVWQFLGCLIEIEAKEHYFLARCRRGGGGGGECLALRCLITNNSRGTSSNGSVGIFTKSGKLKWEITIFHYFVLDLLFIMRNSYFSSKSTFSF